MKALQNPKILGSLLVGSVGAQQANEIQNQLSLGNISLDDVYDTLINFASSPAVSIINEMQTTPSGEVYAPDQEQIDAERKFNEELNKKITTASETPKADILITPDVQETFEPLITLPPEFKLDQEGFTPAPEVKPSDYIMKSEEKKTDLKPNEKIFNQIAGVKNHTVERDPNDLFLEGWEKMIFPSPKQIGSIGNYAVAIDPMKRSDNNFLLVKDGKVHATLELATAMGQDKVLELDAIGVPAEMQGQGIAKDVLNELFKLADANGVTIQGVAQPFGNKALNKKQLISFYKNMGFEVRGDEITRKPVIAEEKSSLVPPIDFSVIPENTPISVKPVPKKVAVDKGLSENEGVYMANVDGQNVDLKNKTFNTANISVTPEGIPKFDVQNAINRDIEKVPGSKLTKVNLFKKSAGWKWLDKPEGGNDSFLVSVEQGGKHYYTLDTNMTADTQLKYYPNEKSEPRLRPTAYDDLVLGNKVGEIDVRGKKHPVYDSIEVSSPKQAVGADVTPKIEMINVPEKSQKDFFETSYEYDTYDGRIEDMEYRYHGGVGDLGDNQAAKTIQKIDGYDDYVMYLQEQAENFLGPEFKGFRITNTKEVMQLLNKQNKNKIKSFTLNPKQAVKFGYFANEAFMDSITTQPRGDLLIIESPIKSTSLVMRGRSEEAEVVSNTARTSIKQSRIYNPYTGEVVYEPTEGPLVGTQPHQFETLIRTESDIAPFISDLQSKYTKTDVTPKTVYSPQDSILKDEIRPVLTKDLLKPQYLNKLKEDDDISCGQCYAASEAAFHMYGKDNGFKSYVLNSKTFPEGLDEGDTHWFLKNKEGEIIDPTAEQFGDITIPYDKGKGTGFLTKNPSNAAQQIIDRVNQNNAQILSGADFISQDIKITGSGKNNKILVNDILTFLDKGKKRDLYNPEDFKAAVNEAVSEIEYQLAQDITGKGWYDEDIEKSMGILEKINPKVIEDPLLKELSLFLTGISSAMTPVGGDFKIAIQMINNFTETGILPSTNPVTGKQWNRNTNLKRQIDFAQKLIDQKGLEGFMSFLFDPISRREINTLRKELANLGPIDPKLDIKSGETIGIDDKNMFGTDAFGPKLGPFLANLHGQSDNNVIDIWNVRGMNRRFGNMFIRDQEGNILTNKEGNIMVADQPRSQKERAQFIRFMNEVASLTNLSVRDAQAILWYYEQGLYTKLGVPSEPKKYSEVAEKFLEEQSNVSQGSLSSSDGIKNKINVPKKKQGGYVIPLPKIDML